VSIGLQRAFAWAARNSTSSPESRYGSVEGNKRIITYTSEYFLYVNSWVPVSSNPRARSRGQEVSEQWQGVWATGNLV
jgi:hypothetical protein